MPRFLSCLSISLLLILTTSSFYRAEDKSILTISVSMRSELLSVVHFISGYGHQIGTSTSFDTSYERDVRNRFTKYADHEAIRTTLTLAKNGFSYDAPFGFIATLSELPELSPRADYAPDIISRAGSKEILDQYAAQLRDFALKSNFQAFFDAHRPFYSDMVSSISLMLKDDDIVAKLEGFFGERNVGYFCHLSPLNTHSYGPTVTLKDGSRELFNFLGAFGVLDGKYSFGNRDDLSAMLLHEFGHGFVNYRMEASSAELSRYSSLFEPIREQMSKQAYSNWGICINEHVLRACVIEIETNENDAKRTKMTTYERIRGFAYVPRLLVLTSQYEKQRGKFPKFSTFIPEIINAFRQLATEELGPEFYVLPFFGPINSVFSAKKKLFVIPTQEETEKANKAISSYATAIRDKIFPDARIIADSDALVEDLSGCGLIVYGTPVGNRFLAKYIDACPIKITADSISAKGRFDGDGLRLIFCMPNPMDKNFGMAVYTALNATVIPDINNIRHGATDYLICRDGKVLESGNFIKTDTGWKMEK